MAKRKPILKPLTPTMERELKVIQEGMRESQRRDVQELLKRKTEPTMHNLDGFYSLIKNSKTNKTNYGKSND